MLHTIGRKPHPEELVEILVACHDRIRGFLDTATAIAGRADVTDDDVVDGSARVQRYFSEAFPLHVEDEEERLLPRLRGRSRELDVALDRMCDEHDRHAAPIRALRGICASLRVFPRDASARIELAGLARQLRADFEPHLDAEERVVFPAIRALLTIDEQRAIVHELRARRRAP